MIVLLSPAKTLDFKSKVPTNDSTTIRFPKEAGELINILKTYQSKQLSKLMNISDSLAQINTLRHLNWHLPIDDTNGRQAVFAFKGEVYAALDAYHLSPEDIKEAQETLRILSGLYGLLRPLDLILPYRLEMGTKLKNKKGKDLYTFWGDKLTRKLNHDLMNGKHQAVINLASQEYYKSILSKEVKATIYTPIFKDLKNDSYKVISFYAKKARGLMAQFIVKNQITNPEDLKAFDMNGYRYNQSLSKEREMVFTRH